MRPRVAVVAAGSHIFQAAHIPALAALRAEVIGVHDADAERAAAVAERHGWTAVDDLDQLLALGADIVVVCAPHPLHRDIVLQALDAGSAVLVEKPVAPRLVDIDQIVAAASDSARPVAVVHQHRFRHEVIEAQAMLRAGALGRIHRAVVTASYPKRSVYYTDTPWRGTWRGEGGGVLLNQGLHDIDLLVHLLGRPDRLAASLRTVVHPIETEDSADLLMEWQDGATGVVHVTSAAVLGENSIEIHGSAGSIRLNAAGLWTRMLGEDFDAFARSAGGHFDAVPVPEWRLDTPAGGGTHTQVYADLILALTDSRPPAVSAHGARAAVEVIAAATVASAQQRWVSIPVEPSSYEVFLDELLAELEGSAA